MPIGNSLTSRDAERSSRMRLDAIHRQNMQVAAMAIAAQKASQAARARRQKLESDAPIATTYSSKDRFISFIMPVLLIGAVLGDILLALPTATWITYSMVGQPEYLTRIRILFPLAVVTLDLIASIGWYQARRDAIPGSTRIDGGQVAGYLLIAVWVMLSFATQWAIKPGAEATSQHAVSFWVKAMALVGFSYICHYTLVTRGHVLIESIDYWMFLVRRASHRRAEVRFEQEYNRQSQETVNQFYYYMDERQNHTDRFGSVSKHNFNGDLREILRSTMKQDPFLDPSGNAENADEAQTPHVTPPPRDPGSNLGPDPDPAYRDEEYYRRIVEDRIRQEETEIRP